MTAKECEAWSNNLALPETILAVHSSGASLGVAVAYRGEVVEERLLPPAREHLERLAPLIGEMVSRLPGKIGGIDAFAIARGPGSFSGIRVGMATLKGMALALGRPLVGVSSLDVLAWQELEPGKSGIALIDARRGELFVQAFTKSAQGLLSLSEPRLIHSTELADFAARFSGPLVLCKDTAVPELPVPAGNTHRHVSLSPSPSVCAHLARERFRRGSVNELHTVVPLYIRRSDAEEKMRTEFITTADPAR